MTTETRPSLARRHTRASDAKRDKELDRGLRVTVEGDVFEARVGDVTPELAREIRATIGMSFMRLMDTIGDDPDVDVLTAFEWVARRIRGENVALADVAFTYDDLLSEAFDIDDAGASEPDEADDPEV